MDIIPSEIKIYFICYQDFKSDMLNMRLINKEFKSIMDKVITLECYPEPLNESLTQLCLLYKSHIFDLHMIELEAAREFEKINIDMLIENGWL